MDAKRIVTLLFAGLLFAPLTPAGANDIPTNDRAVWLLARTQADVSTLGINSLQAAAPPEDEPEPTEVGGVTYEAKEDDGRPSPALPMLMSAVLPGLGEAYTGHKRGYLLMALDVAAWIGGMYYKNEGEEKRDEYYAFADEHWSEAKLAAAYNTPPPGGYDDPDLLYVELLGREYFDVSDYQDLDLWVSREEDEREYYENLGKWDQFVFGWDDFVRADDPNGYGTDYVITGDINDLRQPWTSYNRDIYRQMRDESNEAFEKQDRFLYVNIILRVFSVLQVAYLEGLFGGGGSDNESYASDRKVSIIAETRGWRSSRVGAAVAF